MTRREKCITTLVLVVNLGVGASLLQRAELGRLFTSGETTTPTEPFAALGATPAPSPPLHAGRPQPTD